MCDIKPKDVVVNIIISSILAAIIVGVISLVYSYYFLGPIYAISVVSYSLFNIIAYIIYGLLGGLIGYNINTIKLEKQ